MEGDPLDGGEDVYRALIKPHWWSEKDKRPSSAAFTDEAVFSVDRANLCTANDSARRFRDVNVVAQFNVGDAGGLGFEAIEELDPDFPENLAHAHVYCRVTGNKRKTNARKLAEACKVIHVPPAQPVVTAQPWHRVSRSPAISWFRYTWHRALAMMFPYHDKRFKSPCTKCNGDGRTAGNWCPECDATGWTRSPEQIENHEKWNRGELPWLPPRD